MSSLLAHLYSRIKGSPEDVATMSLSYILENSSTSRQLFTKYIASTVGIEEVPSLTFKTQVVGENNERPDLVGTDLLNNEVIICEAKFWASLTKNQPIGYLKRLQTAKYNSEKVLIFICPEARVINLWGELIRILEEENICITKFDNCRQIIVENIHMSIVSWRGLLNIIKQVLAEECSPLLSDLYQLQGLCERMDEQAFLPFTPDDLGVDKAKRILSYFTIIDKVGDEIINTTEASAKGLRAQPQYGGYNRYIRIGDYGITISFSSKHWIDLAETPYWLGIQDIENGKWLHQVGKAYLKLKEYENTVPKKLFINKAGSNEILIPLYVEPYECEDEVIKRLVLAIKQILNKLEVI